MNVTGRCRAIIRFILFSLVIIVYFIVSALIFIVCGFSFTRARFFLTRVVSYTSSIGLKIIGIEVVSNAQPISPMDNFLIVCNHLTYIDVMVISSLFPSCFVTSKEMKETPFLGQICLLGGCLFVDRKKRSNIHNEIREITQGLNNKLNVAVFPEATTTNGSNVIAFKRPLFQAAIDSQSRVLPMCLNYKRLGNEPVTIKNHDIIFWYDDTSFLSYSLRLFQQKKIIVELKVLPIINSRDYADKNELAETCFKLISDNYIKIIH